MTRHSPSLSITVGIDVGGSSKGFHAVALQGNTVLEAKRFEGSERGHVIGELVRWCVNQRAQAVAVDAPCGWSMDGGSRPCERELQRLGISSFYTPMKAKADGRAFYDWVRNGEALFHALQPHFPLYTGGGTVEPDRRFCFETFPHAITWQRRGGNASARDKKAQRKELLELNLGEEEVAKLKGIDFIDAALCAQMAADVVAGACFHPLGDVQSGFLLVPVQGGQVAGG